MNDFHTSVLLKEVLELLQIKNGSKYIDATLGGGGHAFEILRKNGQVLGIDLDDDALDYVRDKWNKQSNQQSVEKNRLVLAKGNFKDIKEIALLHNFTKVKGIIFDLGISSHQVNAGERGFSFLKEGPLDMRMDMEGKIKAKDLINLLQKGELYEIFSGLGQERHARVISNIIIRTRRIKAIETTKDLVKIIQEAYGLKEREISAFLVNEISQKTFQALRMAVNNELENLQMAIPDAFWLLGKGGRLAVISFHSLEDRIVKNMFLDFQKNGAAKIITKKPIVSSAEESEVNRRSRSAKLRVIEKV